MVAPIDRDPGAGFGVPSVFFSVIVPTYNRLAFLPEALASVRRQTWFEWECVVVDDGSTDGTAAFVEGLCREDKRFRYVYQDNAERSAARNTGMDHALGRYICFLDSDDRYLPNYLQRLAEFLDQRGFPQALVVSGFELWDGESRRAVELPPMSENPAQWLFEHPVSPSRACLHRDITAVFRFREDILIVEDSVLWVSIATRYQVLLLPEPLVMYRVHEGNSSNRSTEAAFKRHAGLMKFFAEPLSGHVAQPLRRALLSDVRFRMAESHARNGRVIRALLTVAWSLLTDPTHLHTKAKLFFMAEQVPGFRSLWRLQRRYRNQERSGPAREHPGGGADR